MAPSANISTFSSHGIKVSITVTFIFSLILLLPISGGLVLSEMGRKESKVLIGSKPPVCVNKCMNCRPCMATVVVPDHRKKKGFKVSDDENDDSYYLLSWKCRCGDKLFQP